MIFMIKLKVNATNIIMTNFWNLKITLEKKKNIYIYIFEKL